MMIGSTRRRSGTTGRTTGGEKTKGKGDVLLDLAGSTLLFGASAFTLWVFANLNACDVFWISEPNVPVKKAEFVLAVAAFGVGAVYWARDLGKAFKIISD